MDERPIPDDWRIPDDLWEAIAPLLPEHKNTHRFGGGRPRKSDRVCMEAILFVLRTGCQWKGCWTPPSSAPLPPPTTAFRSGSKRASLRSYGNTA